jgi:asparagine synthase (glutamine-hydrolysing)
MCGFSGFFGFADLPYSGVQKTILTMGEALRHRGPDDHGVWINTALEIALVHRRLAVVDLSAAGNQPMVSSTGRFILAFNGEIYNHRDIRKLLLKSNEFVNKKVKWRGHSDTETLLVALEFWGIDRTLKELNGMFAFALWDQKERKLFLARDRFGEKPLYYGSLQNSFVFGSELKALAAHSQWRGDIDRDALALFMRYTHVPAPKTIYQDIKKILPAHYLVVSNQGQIIGDPICYWSLENAAYQGIENRKGDAVELADELDYLLKDAVGLRMTSDVPLGAFLSGGYDSTMIVAQMQAQSSQPVRTFSIGNEQEDLDEARYAAAVAKHLGTEHTELYVTSSDALSVIPKLPQIYDEPFADSSQIPTFLVSQLARRDVTVALSGDGGDELFAGYNRHFAGVKIWEKLNQLPLAFRKTISHGLTSFDAAGFARLMVLVSRLTSIPSMSLKMTKLCSALSARDDLDFYDLLKAHWKSSSVILGASDFSGYDGQQLESAKFLDRMLFMDMQTYLQDDILTKVDRASMAVSLEARVPFLDHRLVEFSWRVPPEFKVRNGQGKWLLREVLHRYVPHELMERPKQGFSIPIAQWLRGPLRDWGEELLDSKRLHQEGFFNVDMVRSSWKRLLTGKGHEEHKLWCVLMFQAWLDNQRLGIKNE